MVLSESKLGWSGVGVEEVDGVSVVVDDRGGPLNRLSDERGGVVMI